MDEVICDFLGELCRRYNQHTGAALNPGHLTQYDLTPFVGETWKRLFLQPGFFSELQAFPFAIDTLEKLNTEGYHIIIATDAKGNSAVAKDKRRWVEKHIPFLTSENLIITADKHLIHADLLFDDSPEILERFNGIKVVMDRPYNKEVEAHRIYHNDWLQFYLLVKNLFSWKLKYDS